MDCISQKKTNKAKKILPLLSFGVLLVILGQQIFFYHSALALQIDQELSGRLRQMEVAQHKAKTERHKKSKKSKKKKKKHEEVQQQQESPQQPAQQVQQEQQPQQQEQQQQQTQQESHQESTQDVQQTAQVQVQEQADVQTTQQQAVVQSDQTQQQQQQDQQTGAEQQQAAAAPAQPAPEVVETIETEEKFKPKNQDKFVPSQEKAHRSSLQLPDISITGEEVHQEAVDDITKASAEDTFAYSQVIALDDEAQAKFLKAMEPKPVNAEEDTGSMAQFMLDVSQQSTQLEPDAPQENTDAQQAVELEPTTGADFAAELAQKYEAQQKEREAGRGVAEKIASSSWFQNSQQPQQQSQQDQPQEQQKDPVLQEALQIDY